MQYLIVTNSTQPFLTKWFDYENHFNKDDGMVVFDLWTERFTTDGKTWHEIPKDHL